jgi:hypothetical protein
LFLFIGMEPKEDYFKGGDEEEDFSFEKRSNYY